jgi:hypothetical protein
MYGIVRGGGALGPTHLVIPTTTTIVELMLVVVVVSTTVGHGGLVLFSAGQYESVRAVSEGATRTNNESENYSMTPN